MIADNEIDLAAARALIWHDGWQLDRGGRGGEESSRSKGFRQRGGRPDRRPRGPAGRRDGHDDDLVIGRIYADIRAFRIYDGASEVHRMSIAKRVVTPRLARAADGEPGRVKDLPGLPAAPLDAWLRADAARPGRGAGRGPPRSSRAACPTSPTGCTCRPARSSCAGRRWARCCRVRTTWRASTGC